MEGAEFTRQQASSILIKTLKSVGYSDETARQAVWSALWLKDRGFDGVTVLIVYLCLIADEEFDALRPMRHDTLGLTGKCPFLLAESILGLETCWKPKGGVAFGAPIFPILMIPSVVDWFKSSGGSIQANYVGNTCLASDDGLEFDARQLDAFHFAHLNAKDAFLVELSTKAPSEQQAFYRPVTHIRLPERRLRGTNALFLGDATGNS